MASFDRARQLLLLEELRNLGYGQAESEPPAAFARMLMPVPEHLRAFDPDVVLVVGNRGTGKSELFNAVFTYGLLPALAPYAPDLRLPWRQPMGVTWRAGHPLGAGFPDARGLEAAVRSDEDAVLLWFAYLVRTVSPELPEALRTTLGPLLAPPAGAPDRVLQAFREAGNEPLLALDALDQALQAEDRWLFVGYDELDTLGNFNWDVMARAVRGLVAFWAGYARRWRRLRAKLFLRSDLFERHAGLGGADLAKLAANRAELAWSDANLFAVLLKRMANTGEALAQYCRSSQVRFREAADQTFGRIPDLRTAEDARRLIERMVGPFMGANRNKGRTFRWVLDHLRDGRGRVSPRSLVRLFEQAAVRARANPRVAPPLLLHPTDLRQALEDVSADHVRQATHNEWPWLQGVHERLINRLAPWERATIEADLAERWRASWGTGNIRPPAPSARELLEYLVSLGVFREREHTRVDAPDIFLFGLGLRRRGGVQAGRAAAAPPTRRQAPQEGGRSE